MILIRVVFSNSTSDIDLSDFPNEDHQSRQRNRRPRQHRQRIPERIQRLRTTHHAVPGARRSGQHLHLSKGATRLGYSAITTKYKEHQVPEYGGRKVDNARVVSKASSRWRSLSLWHTQVNDNGIAEIVKRAPNLTEVSIDSEVISDRGIEQLASLSRLVSLLLHHAPNVTNASMEAVGKMTQLRELYLEDTQLTDTGVRELLGFQNLRVLVLTGTRISDTGVSLLANLETIDVLCLDSTNITGQGLSDLPDTQGMMLSMKHCPITDDSLKRYLQSHRKTRALSLGGSEITDDPIKLIGALQKLEFLDLNNTAVTNESIATISQLPELSELSLDNTGVTDEGMKHLLGHANLLVLELRGTAVSSDMAKQLKEQSPGHLSLYQ
ncbi:MAG: hypothetical protein HUJ26_16370 [Planctomycetaceae bacterium]|nr:hypothetical protein [Planctomycetaceae bacterium]